MTFFVFIIGIIIFLLLLERLSVWVKKRQTIKTTHKIYSLDWFSIVLLLLATALIAFSFFAPALFVTHAITTDLDFRNTGPIGDTVGGLMNPFIALAGVIVTGLAFYMQYKANLLQRELFVEGQKESNKQFQTQLNHQQFESQFYEMLRLHKENVNEMELNGKEHNGEAWQSITITKRAVFQEMQNEFESILRFATTPIDNFLEAFDNNKPKTSISSETFKECYNIFFWGFDHSRTYNLPAHSIEKIENVLKDQYPEKEEFDTIESFNLKFKARAYQGHSSLLGHYFRHLFMMVKFVVKSQVMTAYKDKMRYLKILRAQLSNYEQIMLFYNWLGGYGEHWEDNKRKYFTEYCMIHNLWYDELFDNPYIADKIQELKDKPFSLRSKKSELFEIDDNH